MFFIDKRKKQITRILRLVKKVPQKRKEESSNTVFKKLEIWLKRNNIKIEGTEFIIMLSILSSIIIIIGVMNFKNPMISVLSAIFIILIMFVLINIRRKKENMKKTAQLEQFLLDLKGNLYGNPNLLISLEKTIQFIGYPLKADFEIVINDTRRGLLLEEALKKMINLNSNYLIKVILKGIIV